MRKQKAFKFCIYPNKEQSILIQKTFGCTRFIFNKMLADDITEYEVSGNRALNTPASYKKEYEFLKEVDSLALCNAQLNLNRAYTNFFRDKKVGFPKWKKKHKGKKSYTTNLVNGNITLADCVLRLPKVGEVKIKCHRKIPEDYVLKSVTILQRACGKYEASLLYEYEQVILQSRAGSVIGLDYAQAELFVDSDGTSANYPHYFRKAEAKIAREKRKLSRMQMKSNNWCRQKLRIASLEDKVKNQRNDFLHKLSTQIANEYDIVCVEDINLKDLSQCLNLGKNLHDNGFGRFRELLSYKLEALGKQFVKVDKWFPSSKRCSNCGGYHKELSLSDRIYNCPECGNVIDRDKNAAINIRDFGYVTFFS